MAALILIATILLPLLEIYLFVQIGAGIGALTVVVLTVVTAGLGIALVRAQGLGTLRQAQRELDHGRPPVIEMLHGAMLALAGLLLLIPGFLTDAVGGLLLVPPLRLWVISVILRRARPQGAPNVIDAEYREVTNHDRLDTHSDQGR